MTAPDADRALPDLESIPDAWTVWNAEDDGRCILTYRPDVFDADEFPAPCLPTLYLTSGTRSRPPGANPNDRTVDDDWYVTLYLEPDVYLRDEDTRFSTRADALEQFHSLARRFDAGDIDYRSAYQVPRERYLDRLDDLTGRGRDA
ncbi:DUF5820 family protein [Natronobiforma cellulositropha]|uniref:DUF5820 family protein n=1 Tax=Natronobiforma cellulositropha TaxID=1679076 RepID=UPI0021D58E87|nr:DUF5820 family protein [Natronobiforma cellulositropha]